MSCICITIIWLELLQDFNFLTASEVSAINSLYIIVHKSQEISWGRKSVTSLSHTLSDLEPSSLYYVRLEVFVDGPNSNVRSPNITE